MKLHGIFIILLILIVFGIVGNHDYSHDVIETETYCEMVQTGVWPDYKGNYGEVCE